MLKLLASNYSVLKDMFDSNLSLNEHGIYRIFFGQSDSRFSIIVDDKLPTDGQKNLLFSQSNLE